MGFGHGGQGGMMADFYRNFQASFNESLIVAFVAASLVGLDRKLCVEPQHHRACAKHEKRQPAHCRRSLR
jgi:hypothetical protein